MQETNWFHVVTQHPIIAFLIGAVIAVGLILLIAKIADWYLFSAVRRRDDEDK